MDETKCQQRIIQLREQMGLNRKEFCETFDIPYRTVTEWERGNRSAPEYVIRLLEYYHRMELKQSDIIGRTVKVTVDRPMGTFHPKHKDMYYPVNYGYIQGIIAPDGEEQDAYILGLDVAVEEFIGKIIAVIHREDDIEEKWVVCAQDLQFTKEEIEKQVNFQEQYFISSIIM